MFKFATALFLLITSAVTCFAESSIGWLQVKTSHFTIVTDGNERQARHVAGQLERMHAVYAKLLPKAVDDPGSGIVVLAFRDRKGFQAVEPPAYLAKNALDLAGLFLPGQDRNYILLRLDSTGEHPYATVYHEYTHYMLRHENYLPLWLNEGLAQFYQNTTIFDREVVFGQLDTNELLYLRGQDLLPMQTLLSVDHSSPYYHEENKGNIFYAESWALTHLLYLQNFSSGKRQLSEYAEYLAKGEDPVAAAQHAFGDLKALGNQLNSYVHTGNYQALRMQLQNVVDEKAFNVQPMETTDADALRADVLARDGRTREAEALASAVLAESPASPQAHESMGWIRLREGDMEGARKFFGEAVALHSQSYLSHYYYGTLAMHEGPSAPEAAGDSLREAIRLNPHFAPALEALAQFDTLHQEKLDEALSSCLQAVAADPGNIDYRLTAAEVRLQRKELPSAITGLQATEKVAQSAADRERVHERLEQVQHYQDQLNKAQAMSAGNTAEMAAGPHLSRSVGSSTVKDAAGTVLHPTVLKEPDHTFPSGPPVGPKKTITGTVRHVSCFYPKGMTLQVEGTETPLPLYSNDMYAVSYTAGNFTPEKDLNPCTDFEGLHAKITFGTVEDSTVAGQILAMELNK